MRRALEPLALHALPALLALALLPATPARAAGTFSVQTMRSPADGASISYGQYLPNGYVTSRRWPLIVSLHGRGGDLSSNNDAQLRAAADAKGYVVVFYDGRQLPGNGGRSSYYVDAPGASGLPAAPDESDVLGILDDAVARLAIDPDRVFLAGGSMGGKGTWGIGLRNPHRFAALAPAMGPTDAWVAHAKGNAGVDFVAGAGGTWGTSPTVDAMWYTQSPRFYLENARGLPILVGHGDRDDVVPNTDQFGRYHHSHHVTDDPTYYDERGQTVTLSQLDAREPGAYPVTTRWVPTAGHQYLTVLPPTVYFEFFEGKRRNPRPSTVVYTAWDGAIRDRQAYWLRVRGRASRWTVPVRVRVDADARGNALDVQAPSDATVTVDLAAAGLRATEEVVVRVTQRDGPGTTTLVLLGEVKTADVRVSLDGRPFAAGYDGSAVTLKDVPVSTRPRTLVITPVRSFASGLTYPNGGEVLAGGSRLLVRWTPTLLTHITGWRLLLSTDGGSSFTTASPELSSAYTDFPIRLGCEGVASARVRLVGLSGSTTAMTDDSDGTFSISAAPAPCGTAADADLVLPGAASTQGAGGSRWSTQATLASMGGPLRVGLELYAPGTSPSSTRKTPYFDLPEGGSTTIGDVVSTLAPEGGAGAIGMRVVAGEPADLVAGGRTSTPPSGGGAGTYGFYLRAMPASEALAPGGGPFILFGPDAASRSNLGLFALDSSRLLVEPLDESGRVLDSVPVTLSGGEWTQLSGLEARYPRASVVRLVPTAGRVHAYLTAVSSSATNDPQGFRPVAPGSSSFLLPSIVSAPGASGAYFRSDLYLHNPGAEAVSVRLRYRARESVTFVEAERVLAAGQTLTIPDALAALFPASAPGSGTLEVYADEPFLAASVAYNEGPEGRAGQEFPALSDWWGGSYAPFGGLAAGLAEDASYRSNLVLVNQWAQPIEVTLRATSADGLPLGEDVVVTVRGDSSMQLNRVLSFFNDQPVTSARLTILPKDRGVSASVSLIDNATNDPTSLPVVPVR